MHCCRIWNWFPICKRNHCPIVKLFIIFGTNRVQVCFIWCFQDVWTWHCSRSQVGNGTVVGIDRMAGQVMVLTEAVGPCHAFFLLPLQSFSSSQKWNNQNELLFTMIDSQQLLFPNVRADSGLKAGKLQSVFESAFSGTAMLFAVDELTVKDCLQKSSRGHLGDMTWPPEVMLEDGSFNAQHFWTIGDFVVGASVLPELGLFETFKHFSGPFDTGPSTFHKHMFVLERESVVVEYALVESSEGPMIGFLAVINVSFPCSSQWECVAKVLKVVDNL